MSLLLAIHQPNIVNQLHGRQTCSDASVRCPVATKPANSNLITAYIRVLPHTYSINSNMSSGSAREYS
jgi:hypothetical protein